MQVVPSDAVSDIAAKFQIPHPIEVEGFSGRGNINLDAYLVRAGENGDLYLLQRINELVFSRPDYVMQGMESSIAAQSRMLAGSTWRDRWRIPDLVPTFDGTATLDLGGTWRMQRFLHGTVSFKSLADVPPDKRAFVASEIGRGLAIYSDLTADIDPSRIPVSLPGYRNTRLYYHQFHAALEGARTLEDTAHRLPVCEDTRRSSEPHFVTRLPEEERQRRRHDPELAPFIALALEQEEFGVRLQLLRETGQIRETAIHGDTKIENFLFDAETCEVVALVDLDTVMPHTWLADWGDMMRSLCNVAGEKERDLSLIQVDRDVYRNVLEGFLEAADSPTDYEVELMPSAVKTITLELGVRFLADYLRGDSYFGVTPDEPDLNKTRAMVQLRLFERLSEHEALADSLVRSTRRLARA